MKPVPQFKRVLLVRLDRLGDVVLSLPVAQALRAQAPHAFIAMLVSPACAEVVEGHPALNEVLVYDKAGAQRGWLGTWRFARRLHRLQCEVALVLHPSHRSHWLVRLAGIPTRIGWNRKMAWLLTHRVPHRKQEGQVHEAAYTLQLLEALGIRGVVPRPMVPVSAEAAQRVHALLAAQGVAATTRLVAVHPSASCISKRWLPERFAQVADRLQQTHGVTICLVAGPQEVAHADAVARQMRTPALNLAGRLRVRELAALLQRSALLISNDSGPVHLAAAVGTPVVDLFGRNQAGLSPRRWGPLGEGHVVLHKEVGCVTCLAHACDIGFKCLTAIEVEDVYQAAVSLLAR
jgi:heptosyltransferase-2